jgi:hypothetical protein
MKVMQGEHAMSDAKLRAARELIEAEEYDAAKSILVTLDDPEAQEMLLLVDQARDYDEYEPQYAPPRAPRKRLRTVQVEQQSSPMRALAIIAVVLGLLIGLGMALFVSSPGQTVMTQSEWIQVEQVQPEGPIEALELPAPENGG